MKIGLGNTERSGAVSPRVFALSCWQNQRQGGAMLRKLLARWGVADSVISLADYTRKGVLWLIGPTALSSVIAWASTTWAWYWDTFNLFGVALAFLGSQIILAAVFLVLAFGVRLLQPTAAPAAGMIPDTRGALDEIRNEIAAQIRSVADRLSPLENAVQEVKATQFGALKLAQTHAWRYLESQVRAAAEGVANTGQHLKESWVRLDHVNRPDSGTTGVSKSGARMRLDTAKENWSFVIRDLQRLATQLGYEADFNATPNFDENPRRPAEGDKDLSDEIQYEFRRAHDQVENVKKHAAALVQLASDKIKGAESEVITAGLRSLQ